MDNNIKTIYKNIKKLLSTTNTILKYEKIILKISIIKFNLKLLDEHEMDIKIFIKMILDEIDICVVENNESIKCLNQIMKCLKSTNKVNLNNDELLYYLSTIYEYYTEIHEIYKSRVEYKKEKILQFENAINGINYYNPDIISRDGINEKIKTYKSYFENIDPKKI